MRAAVAAVIVLALVVVSLLYLAVETPVPAVAETASPSERPSAAPINPFRQSARELDSCPQPGEASPSLTGCPDETSPAAAVIGMGDLRRIESLPPQGWP